MEKLKFIFALYLVIYSSSLLADEEAASYIANAGTQANLKYLNGMVLYGIRREVTLMEKHWVMLVVTL